MVRSEISDNNTSDVSELADFVTLSRMCLLWDGFTRTILSV